MPRRPSAAPFALLLAALLLAPAAAAQPRTATFGEYASPVTTEHQATVGLPVTSGGLDFYELFAPGARNALGTWGTDPADPGAVNRPANLGSSTAMFVTQLGLEVDAYGAGTDIVTGPPVPFGLLSIDVGHLYSTAFAPVTLSSFTLTFFGFGPSTDAAVIDQTFVIPAPAEVGGVQTPVLTTLAFDERWRSMHNVWWFQGASSTTAHQFTNVVSTVVPEPGTWLLTLTGLGGLGGLGALGWRRRPA